MTTHIRRAIALVAILTTILAALPLAASAQDTSSDKELCKNGGWQELTRADGTPFTNQGECIKYIVSEGGTFEDTTEEPPEEGLQLHAISSFGYGDTCTYLVYLTGLTPESGKFELWKQFADGSPEMTPFAGGWNGFGITIYSTVSLVPATFTVYPNGVDGAGAPLDTVTIASCGESS